jgi:predicted Fe-Mo cluster-binding NifX family protein
VVVGGIGQGALFKFQAANIGVYLSEYSTVNETLAAHKAGSLRPLSQGTCAGHGAEGHGSGCGH